MLLANSRLVLRVLLIVFVLYAGVALGVSYLVSSEWAEEIVRDDLLPVLQRQLSLDVAFDDITPAGLGRVRLTNLRLVPRGQEPVTIEALSIQIDLARLLLVPWQWQRAISQVTIENLNLVISRNASGEWSFPVAFSGTKGENGTGFVPNLTFLIRNSQVTVSGWPNTADSFSLSEIRGSGHVTGRGVTWSIDTKNSLISAGKTTIQGRIAWGENRSQWQARIVARDLDIRSYQESGVFAIPGVDLQQGKGDVTVILKGKPGAPLAYLVDVTLESAGGKVDYLPQELRQVTGRVWYDGEVLGFEDLRGSVGTSSLAVSGRVWGWANPTLDLRVTADLLELGDAAAILSYNGVPAFAAERIEMAGKVRGDLVVAGPVKDPTLRGQLSIADGSVSLAGLTEPLTDIGGSVEFRPGKALVDLSFGWLDGETRVAGQVTSLFDPVLDLQIETALPVKRLTQLGVRIQPLQALEVAGQLGLQAEVFGPWQAPVIRSTIQISDLSLHGVQMGDLQLAGSYKDGRFDISQLTVAQPGGGELKASGFLNAKIGLTEFALGEFAFGVKLENLDVASEVLETVGSEFWPDPVDEWFPQLQDISGSLLAKGDGGGLDSLVLSSTLEVRNFRWRRTDFQRMTVGFILADSVLRVDYLQLLPKDALQAEFFADGDIRLGRKGFTDAVLDLDVSIEALELAGLELAEGLTGRVSFQGQIIGNLLEPVALGDVRVDQPGWKEYQADVFAGEITWKDGLLQFSQGRVELAGETVQVSGTLALAPKTALAVKADLDDVSLSTVLSLYKKAPPISGRVSGSMNVSIDSEQITGGGSLEASQVAWGGEEIPRLSLEFELEDDSLTIRNGQAEAFGGLLCASGKVTASGWEVDLNLDKLDAGQSVLLRDRIGAAGVVSGEVQVRGALRHPNVYGTFVVQDVAWRDYRLDRVDGQAGYEDGQIVFSPIYLRHDQSVYALSGNVDVVGEPQMDLRIQLVRGSVQDVLSFLGATVPSELVGELDGYVHLWGDISAPTGRVYLSVNNGSIYGTSLEGDVDVTLYGSKVQVNRLRLEHGQGLLVGQGTLAKAGEIDFFLAGQALPLTALGTLVGVPTEVAGTADGELVLSGTAANPQAQLTVDIAETTLAGVELGNIKGKFSLSGSRLFVTDLQVKGRDYNSHASGYLDLPAEMVEKLGVANGKSRDDAEINLTLQLPESRAFFLTLIVPEVAVQRGTIWGELGLGGTWEDPEVSGSIYGNGIAMTYPGLGLVKDIELAANLRAGNVVVERLIGSIGDGTASVSGTIGLQGFRPSYLDLSLTTDNVEYSNTLFSAVFNSALTISGPFAMPTIGGTVAVKEGKVQLKLPKMAASAFDANLDLEVKTFDDVIVRGFGVDLMLAGAVHVGGSVSEPALDGKVTATRGNFSYFGTKFSLVHGSAEFAPARGLNPYLNVRSAARIEDTDVTLLLEGTLDNLSAEFRSDPEMSDQELMAMLKWPDQIRSLFSGSSLQGQLDEEVARLIEAELIRQFVGDLASTFQTALHLDDLEIRPSFMEKSIQIELGKYVVDDLYITYSRKLQEFMEQEWGIEYRLNSNVVLEGSIDSSGEKRVELKGKFTF